MRELPELWSPNTYNIDPVYHTIDRATFETTSEQMFVFECEKQRQMQYNPSLTDWLTGNLAVA